MGVSKKLKILFVMIAIALSNATSAKTAKNKIFRYINTNVNTAILMKLNSRFSKIKNYKKNELITSNLSLLISRIPLIGSYLNSLRKNNRFEAFNEFIEHDPFEKKSQRGVVFKIQHTWSF